MKKIIILLIISIGMNCTYAQFNTLTYSSPKEEAIEKVVNQKENNDSIQKKKVNKVSFFKKVRKKLGITTKRDLKNEIDSLKALIKSNTIKEDEKEDFTQEMRKIKSSIVKETSKKIDSLFSHKYKNLNKVEKEIPFETKIKDVVMPLADLFITSNYGLRVHPVSGETKTHNGVDLRASFEPVASILDGVVSDVGYDKKGGGIYIKVRHSPSYETSYLHLSKVYYAPGDKVKAGDIIAKSGNTGNSTGPHLHFAVKENGKFINPINFLKELVKIKKIINYYGQQQLTNR